MWSTTIDLILILLFRLFANIFFIFIKCYSRISNAIFYN